MSVGILIITHGEIGQAIHHAAMSVIGSSPLRTRCLAVTFNSRPDVVLQEAQVMLGELDTGSGVLILTDMFGATPSNIACTLPNRNIAIVSGLNLPMLIRVMNYPGLPLRQLADKAISGGKEGVICFQAGVVADVAQGS